MDGARPKDLCDTLQIQSALEGYAARLAAQRGISSAQSALLQQVVAAMAEIASAFESLPSELLDRYVTLSRRFHQLVFELAQCSVLQRQVGDEFVSLYSLVLAQAATQARAEALRKFMLFEQDQHRSLIDAIMQQTARVPRRSPKSMPASTRGS
jgi:GntR family transcriptional regulator of vanillate catabolism